MKKMFLVAMVVALVAAFTVPAMAETNFSFKGEYRVRGFMLSNPSLQADQEASKAVARTGEGPSQSWMDMRFRMQGTFTVSDRLSVVTRFDALDNKKWGQDDDDTTGVACPNRNSNLDFDRAYMVIKADFGTFQVGRMAAGMYGNGFLDTEVEGDRVRFDTQRNNWLFSAIYEKAVEQDADDCTGMDVLTDADADVYYLTATYKSEDLSGGLQLSYTNDKTDSDNINYNPVPGGNYGVGFDSNTIALNPFVDASFGDFTILAEAQLNFGKFAEFDRDMYLAGMNRLDNLRKNAGLGPQSDVDWDAYAWNLEGQWASGPFGAELGYAWVKGEDNMLDDKMESIGGLGDDWGKAFILTNTDSGFEGSLGSHAGAAAIGVAPGNLSSGSTAALNGCKMIYVGGSYAPLDNLKVSALLANSQAESPSFVGIPGKSASFASDHGTEYDLTVDWTVYDNLNYTFIAAYLDAGDYWQYGNPYRDLENTWCFWQQLKLTF